MAITINTNVASLNAQKNLNNSQSALNDSMERLSSGLRINSAKDDAAGLAISDRMTAQINGMDQAVRNANDAISMTQTAEGALQESTNLLQRVRELAVQAANDTNTDSDRESIQAEADQLLEEMDRIATSTQFNGQTLLDGTMSDATFHVGANANESISFSIAGARTSQLGAIVNEAGTVTQSATGTLDATDGAGVASVATDNTSYNGVSGASSTGSNIEINGVNIGPSADYVGADETYQGKSSAYALAAAINASDAGVTAVADNTQSFAAEGTSEFTDNTVLGNDTLNYSLSINGTQVFSQTFASGDEDMSLSDAVDQINSFSDDTGVSASVNDSGELELQASDGRDINIAESFTLNDDSTADNDSTFSTVFTDFTQTDPDATADNSATVETSVTYKGQVTLQDGENVTVSDGAEILGLNDTGNSLVLSTEDEFVLSNIDLTSVEGANEALLSLDAALSSIDSSRGDMGAYQNRFESTIANLQNVSENLTAARSQILDTDIASETSEMTKQNILQQAGVSILSQANQTPQLALSLIG